MDSCFAPVVLNFKLNLSPPLSDQERISPYNANTISGRQVMRMEKISIKKLSVDSIPNSHKENHKNCMADTEEKYQLNEILGMKGLNDTFLINILYQGLNGVNC